MSTQLLIYNEALRILGQPPAASTTDVTEDVNQLNGAWPSVVASCMAMGTWTFLMKRAQLPLDVSTPTWGYQFYYTLPNDFSRLCEISESGFPGDELLDYETEQGKIATNAATVFIKYISNNTVAITPGAWSQDFADFVSAALAVRIAPKINPSGLELANAELKTYRGRALGSDAIQNPPAARQPGNWARAPRGLSNRREGGWGR